MENLSSRFIQIDNWIFEVKSVRAIRVDHYGEPYTSISQFSFNGDTAYIDGFMTKKNCDFSRKDYQVFYRMCQQLGIKEVQFNRFKNNKLKLESCIIAPQHAQRQPLQLVR